ncbi:hypothetical protein LTR85_007116 [Meristemomyces frigidus]|nr:hypothetical protein LTR85_007116 [Meristemomyces frigidus]
MFVKPSLDRLTPAICRASHQLHRETLPIYARNHEFVLEIGNSDSPKTNNHHTIATIWLQALGPLGIAHVRNLQLYSHWNISQPVRFQGHVGFYVRISKTDNTWECATGTSPSARDRRGMRLESVKLLQSVIQQNVLQPMAGRTKQAFLCSDVELVIAAMEVVASHTISAFEPEQSDSGKERRHEIWADMERQLLALGTTEAASPESRQSLTP